MKDEFCSEHQEMKVCTKGIIGWPKFISIMVSIIVLAVTVTGMVTSGMTSAIEKIDHDSKKRDDSILLDFKDSMRDYVIPMGKDITEIKTALGIKRK